MDWNGCGRKRLGSNLRFLPAFILATKHPWSWATSQEEGKCPRIMERARRMYKEGQCSFYTRHRLSALPYLTEPWLAVWPTPICKSQRSSVYISLHLCLVGMWKTARSFRSVSRARDKSGNALIRSRGFYSLDRKFSLTFYGPINCKGD
jgi:hypothetical protein